MSKTAWIFVALLVAIAQAAIYDEAKQEQLYGVTLELRDNGGRCQLTSMSQHQRSVFALSIPWPCDFHRGTDSKVRIYMHRGAAIALIESSRPHPSLPKDCETELQAMKVRKGVVSVSKHTDKVASCPPFQWDQKMFTGLFGE